MGEAKKLLSNSGIVFIGSIVGSFFAYLFNMVMGRMLGPEHYGEMTAIMSMIAIISVGGGALLTVTMRYASELYSQKQYKALGKLFKVFTKYIFIASVAIFVIGLFFINPIGSFFDIKESTPVVIAFASLIFGFLIVVNRGVMQGAQRFVPLSVTNALETFFRVLFGVILVKIGLALNGAISAILLATAFTYLLTMFPIKKVLLLAKKDKTNTSFKFDKKEIIGYSWPTLVTTLLLSVALNLDVILVKHYFPSNEAGLYAAISTVGKIIYYLTGPVISVMFPMISERKVKGERHYKTFFISLILTAIGSLLVLGVYTAFPGTIMRLLYGANYTSLYFILPQVGVMILFYTLINLMSNYFLAIKDFTFTWFFTLAVVLLLVTAQFYHPTILIVLKLFILDFALIFVLMFGYYLYTKKEQLANYLKGEYVS